MGKFKIFLQVVKALGKYGSRAVAWAWSHKGTIYGWIERGFTVGWIVDEILKAI